MLARTPPSYPRLSTRRLAACTSSRPAALSHGDRRRQLAPRAVEFFRTRPAASVSCGSRHNAVVTADGALGPGSAYRRVHALQTHAEAGK